MSTNPNMRIWDMVARPPADALKKISGGRLSGMSDVNPQHRYQAMTEVFGVCGFGWKFTIDRLWTEPGPDGNVFAFACVSVYVKLDGEWSDAIPGQGGNFLVEKEARGLHASDEGFKMAITDALGTAMKMLGVAADVYRGRWDGSKYRDSAPPAATPPANTPPAKPAFVWSTASSADRKAYILQRVAAIKQMADPVQSVEQLKNIVNKLKPNDLSPEDQAAVIDVIVKAEQDILAENS